jgi:GNAT superfamily N-acetyltransferase
MSDLTLDAFLASNARNAWIVFDEHLKAYVRRSIRHIDGARRFMFDIASVEVEESFRGQGLFRSFLELVETRLKMRNDFYGCFVEIVLEPRLAKHLLSCGYADTNHNSNEVNLFKRISFIGHGNTLSGSKQNALS